MDTLKVSSLSEKFKLVKEQHFNIRLHDHGLLRLIPLSVDHELFKVTDKFFFHTLVNSQAYQEMFFDHFSQKSVDRHGPFLLDSIKDDDFTSITNSHLREEIIQVVSTPKWSCPPIGKRELTNVKKLLDTIINHESEPYFLKKCLTFNSSSQEATVYEHEWSHSLSSYYEYVLKDIINKKIFLLIITYE